MVEINHVNFFTTFNNKQYVHIDSNLLYSPVF